MSPLLLALETSTEFCSVALATPAKLFLQHEHTGPRSSLRTLPLVQTLLDQAQLKLLDMQAIAFGAGPGSFTGLRNACAIAQGLAFGLSIPVIAVDNLLACAEFARQTAGHQRILVAIDARMGEVYWGEYYYAQSTWHVMTPPALSKPTEVIARQQNECIAGNACILFTEHFKQYALPLLGEIVPRADYIAQLGLTMMGAGLAPEQAAPLYIRNKVALTTAERAQV